MISSNSQTEDSRTENCRTEEIIIGIDPGTRITGYGVVAVSGNTMRALDYGCIRPPVNALLSDRYFIIYESLQELFSLYKPTQMAIETQFLYKNAQSALKLGTAQGVAIISAKKNNMRIFGYAPTHVKSSMVGTGKASKQQLQQTVARYLNLTTLPQPQDAADALAIAICHLTLRNNKLFSQTKNYEL